MTINDFGEERLAAQETVVEGAMRVWWIPQVPMKPFYVPVSTCEEAMKILEVLAEYDIFQFENKVKPDYCNAGGLMIFEDGEWTEWCSFDGDSIDDLMRERGMAA